MSLKKELVLMLMVVTACLHSGLWHSGVEMDGLMVNASRIPPISMVDEALWLVKP